MKRDSLCGYLAIGDPGVRCPIPVEDRSQIQKMMWRGSFRLGEGVTSGKPLTLTLRSPPNALPEEEAGDQLVDFVVIDVGMVTRE